MTQQPHASVKLGSGPAVFPLGLGCMVAREAGVAWSTDGGELAGSRRLPGDDAAVRGRQRRALAVAWVRARQPDIPPLVGSRTEAQLREALGALDVALSSADLQAIEQIAPAVAFAGDAMPPPRCNTSTASGDRGRRQNETAAQSMVLVP